MSSYKIAIVVSQFNKEISDNLLEGALDEYNQTFEDSRSNIDIFDVPGAFEIPGTIMKILKNNKKYHAIIALGNVIKGETAHFEYISSSVTHSISKIQILLRTMVLQHFARVFCATWSLAKPAAVTVLIYQVLK